jgi:perosamine synthetase
MNARRAEIIRRYLNGIRDCSKIKPLLPYELENAAYWLFGVRCDQRDKLIIHLKKLGIATGVHFLPLPLHPLFSQFNDPIPVAKGTLADLRHPAALPRPDQHGSGLRH